MTTPDEHRISAFVDDVADEEDIGLLMRDVESSPECRQELAEELHLVGQTAAALVPDAVRKRSLEVIEAGISTFPVVSDGKLGDAVLETIHRRNDGKRTKIMRFWLGVAAAIICLVFVGRNYISHEALPPIAVIMEAGAGFDVYRSERIFAARTDLPILERDVVTGVAASETLVARYPDGTVLSLDGIGKIELRRVDRAKHLHLSEGVVHFDVAPQETGFPFVITTPHARLKVIGTTFDVTVTDLETRLAVTSGSVSFQNLYEDRVMVEAEQDAVARRNEREIRYMIPDLQASPEERQGYDAWKRWSIALSQDPTVIGYYDFEEENHGSGHLTNKATSYKPDGLYVRNVDGRIRTTTWSDGRFGGLKKALLFQDLGFVDCSADHSYRKAKRVTVFVWFRVSAFSKANQALVTLGAKGWGLERYQKTDNLVFRAGKGHAIGKSSVNDDGWHLAVGTHDTKETRLYIDGKLEAKTPSRGLGRDSGKRLLIGATDGGTYRDFQGWIDEVGIFDRALSPKEVTALYEIGLLEGAASSEPGSLPVK